MYCDCVAAGADVHMLSEQVDNLQPAPDTAVLEAPVSKRWSLVILLSFFSLAALVLYSTYTNFPVLHE